MKNNDNTKKPSLQVSQETANFIGCLAQMQTLYSSVYAAIENLYGDQDAQQMINRIKQKRGLNTPFYF